MTVMAPIKKPNFTKLIKKKNVQQCPPKSGRQLEEIPREVLVIAQEVKFVQLLAHNDINIRNKQMRKLKKWLYLRSRSSFPFVEENFMRLWKGLYYHMWFSDKPLVQEELAEEMGKLLECFDGNVEMSINFFGAFMKTMCIQWFGMDQWRVDKYMMLVRRMLRYMFRVLKENGWSKEAVQKFNDHMTETILSNDTMALGLSMHYLDIFCEELAKVADGEINGEQVAEFVRPFVQFLISQSDFKLIEHCRKKVFHHLLFQSELGREYQEKYQAWRDMGFPTRSINDLEKEDTCTNDQDTSKEINGTATEEIEKADAPSGATKHLDPRAGNVDVFVAELPLDGKYIIDQLEALLIKEELNTKRRKMVRNLEQIFETYNRGEFPLGVKTMPKVDNSLGKTSIKEKAEELENLENELYGTERKLKQLNKRKRRKLLRSLNFEDADESNYNQIIEKALPKQLLKEKRKKIQQAMMSGWVEEEIAVEEVVSKKPKLALEQKKQITTKKRKVNINQENITAAEPAKKIKKSLKILNELNKPTLVEITKLGNEQPIKVINTIETNLKKNEQIIDKLGEVIDNSTTKPEVIEVNLNNKQTKTKPNVSETPKVETKQPKVLKIGSPPNLMEPNIKLDKPELKPISTWNEPLAEGEVEYFFPSNKLRLKEANRNLKVNKTTAMSTPIRSSTQKAATTLNTPQTPASVGKRVKIALKHNTSQNPSEYLNQIRNSPDVPYDASKKPGKGLLKPNSIPSPINPFYKKKIGLNLLNDTI